MFEKLTDFFKKLCGCHKNLSNGNKREQQKELDEAGDESFPASDPPAWSHGNKGEKHVHHHEKKD